MTRTNELWFEKIRLMLFLSVGSIVLTACASSVPTADVSPSEAISTVQPDDTVQTEATTTVASHDVQAEEEGPDRRRLLAHRGVHQTFDPEGVDDETCTATRIDPPTHDYLENTIASMEAAFAAGASVVEIDIAPTSDGVLAVFHDWTVGCRTEGTGEIRSLTWAELSQLDVGYGYTADGETYPFRGRGVGQMPRLEEVFETFPDGQFLINFKSNDTSEASMLQQVVERQGADDRVWAVYGAQPAVEAYVAQTGTRGFSRESVGVCLAEYVIADGGNPMPDACKDTIVMVPWEMTSVLSGWPYDFIDTMERHGTDVILRGPNGGGIDTDSEFDSLPKDIDVYLWTNRVEALG